MKLTERQRDILCLVVEDYAATATPVGSATVAGLVGVSPATVRADMAKLEAFGLIAQPHTSAGRVPTDAGYRYYVNDLAEQEPDYDEFDDELEGDVEDRVENIFEKELNERLDEKFGVKPLNRGMHGIEVRVMAQSRVDAAIRGAVDALVDLTGNLGLATIDGQLYMAGISKLFAQPEFEDPERVQSVAELLDNLEPWLREAAPGDSLNIFIGRENPIGKSSEMSLIISRFRSSFSDRSYIGVLGPMRQNYARVMSLVQNTGKMLEDFYKEESEK